MTTKAQIDGRQKDIRQVIAAKQAKLLEIGGPDLVDAFNECYRVRCEEKNASAYSAWVMGKHLNDMDDREGKKCAKKGEVPTHRSQKALVRELRAGAFDGHYVKRAKRFHRCFPNNNAYTRLMARLNCNGLPLSWSVIRHLVAEAIPDEKRAALFEAAFEHGYTEQEIMTVIDGVRPKDVENAGGAPIKAPRNLFLGLGRWSQDNARWLNYNRTVFRPEAIAEVLKNTELDKADVETIAKIRTIRDQLLEMNRVAGEVAKALMRIEDQVGAALAGTPADAEAGAVDEVADAVAEVAEAADPAAARREAAVRKARELNRAKAKKRAVVA